MAIFGIYVRFQGATVLFYIFFWGDMVAFFKKSWFQTIPIKESWNKSSPFGRKPVFTLNNPMVMVTAQTASNIL